MTEAITGFFRNLNLSNELVVFIISMLPIVELRGAIPVGVAMNLAPWTLYILAVIGNLLPVPFLILFIRPIINYLMTTKMFAGFATWLKNKAEKHSEEVVRYEFWGLMIFVAIPLPGTGAWTGALIAAFLDLRLKNAFLSIALGVLAAGIIMMFGSNIIKYCISLF